MGASAPYGRTLQAVSQHWLRRGPDSAGCGASLGNSQHPEEVNSGAVSAWITADARMHVCVHICVWECAVAVWKPNCVYTRETLEIYFLTLWQADPHPQLSTTQYLTHSPQKTTAGWGEQK